MRPREVRRLIQLRSRAGDRTARALSQCFLIDDVQVLARRRLPSAVFDYVAGGAEEEMTLQANRAAFRAWRFQPLALRDVSEPDLSVGLLGRRLPLPLGFAPTGFTRMIHPGGELAVASVALSMGLPYALSTVGTTTIESFGSTGHKDLWFQLYVLRDRGFTRSLLERAADAGISTLEVAVDTPVSSRRVRDLRNGLTIPPSLTPRTVLDIARHLRYWTAMVRSSGLEFANLGTHGFEMGSPSAVEISKLYDPSVTWDDLEQLRSWWPETLLLKGPISPGDARRAEALGIDGIHVSNHGGRQLDRCLPSLELARRVRDEIRDGTALVLDSGIRHGSDIAVALALGVDLCMVGRPYLYGLAAGGARGVQHVVDLLAGQLRNTMQLLGVTSTEQLRTHAKELLVHCCAREA